MNTRDGARRERELAALPSEEPWRPHANMAYRGREEQPP